MSNKPQMVTGFNHNIKHGGQIYHVQTEDSGVSNPHIITHLFVGGNILATKKTSYADIVKANNLQDIVRELMQEQHKAMLRNLINGVYDDIASTASPTMSPNKALGTEPSIPGKFPEPPKQKDEIPPSTQTVSAVTQPSPLSQPGAESTASTLLPKTVPTPALKSQPVHPTQPRAIQTQPSALEQQAQKPTEALPPANVPQSQSSGAGFHKNRPDDTVSLSKPPTKTTGSAGGFSRPKTSPKIFIPKEAPEKVPPKRSTGLSMAIQARNFKEHKDKKKSPASSENSASLPPEVLAARRLSEKPKPKDTSGPTIFEENLISEKSLDEVILGYLAGNDDDKG